MKIIQLPDTLANQIAAGEVVERPASVVKELVENSIDANSKHIQIILKEAGLEYIRIVDDGVGISADDCERAFLRHATSKIRTEHDLFRVKTLGFRGEALASIASVSRMQMKTSTGKGAGTILEIEGGRVVHKDKGGARRGTEITVKDLFYNTPARLKYMKTIHTELGHITDLLTRFSLSNPHIRFEATHNGRNIFRTTGSGNLLQVFSQIYGLNVGRKMIPVEGETIDFHIKGLISKPELTRASRAYITLIINGRYIRSQALTQAVIRAYHTLLPVHRYPMVVLAIELDPYLVDVNVHPTKLEVRFSKEKELVERIEQLLKETFEQHSLIPTIEKSRKRIPSQTVQEKLMFDSSIEREAGTERKISPSSGKAIVHQYPLSQIADRSTHSEIKETVQRKEDSPAVSDLEEELLSTVQEDQNVTKLPNLHPIGQLHGTYILAQNEEGLFMVDQHAAQERIFYEYFRNKLREPKREVQQLIVPMMFDFSRQEMIMIEEHRHLLEEIGLFLEPFGETSYMIRSYPTWFPKDMIEEITQEIVEQILTEQKITIEKIRDESVMMMACKQAIKANHSLNYDEMVQLLEELNQTENPYTCPHGRPITVHFTTYEIEKMFKRIM